MCMKIFTCRSKYYLMADCLMINDLEIIWLKYSGKQLDVINSYTLILIQ